MNALALTVLIGIAGGIGSALRYLVGHAVYTRAGKQLPLGTWAVNMIGSFALGLGSGAVMVHLESAWFAVFAIGLCGGFTTFSTAALDTTDLVHQGRWRAVALNALGMLVVCVLLAAGGLWLGAKL